MPDELCWEEEPLGQQMLECFSNAAIYIVISSRMRFEQMDKLNYDNKMLRSRWLTEGAVKDWEFRNRTGESWDENADTTSVASYSTAAGGDGNNGAKKPFGLMALTVPQYLHEKQRENLPSCFLFGRHSRKHKIDVCLSPMGDFTALSRSHFGIGVRKSCWVLQSLNGSVVVGSRDLDPGMPCFALNPDEPNEIEIGDGDIRLNIYCRKPQTAMDNFEPIFGQLDLDDLEVAEVGDGLASMTTTRPAIASTKRRALPNGLIVLKTRPIKSRTNKKWVALDGWTCDYYVAKEYQLGEREILQQRLELLQRLPPLRVFLRDERLEESEGSLFMLASYVEHGWPAFDLCKDRDPIDSEEELQHIHNGARVLFETLLRIVGLLHGLGIVHNDISLHTVFLCSEYCELESDQIRLTGFSEISEDMDRAAADCFHVFKTVKDFLGPAIPTLPPNWLENGILEVLWDQCVSGDSDGDSWPCNAAELCSQLHISTEVLDEQWTDITISKDVMVNVTRRDGMHYLSATDIQQVLNLRESSFEKRGHRIHDLRAGLDSITKDGLVSVHDYKRLEKHAVKKHACSLATALRRQVDDPDIGRRIEFSIPIVLSYQPRYGLVNVDNLRWLAPASFLAADLGTLTKTCFEVRGPAQIRGMYVPQRRMLFGKRSLPPQVHGIYVLADQLEAFAGTLGFRFDSKELNVGKARDTSVDRCTHPGWYLIPVDKGAALLPVDRETGLAHLPSDDTVPLQQVMDERWPAETPIDVETAFQPWWLEPRPAGAASGPPTHSCGGSITLATTRAEPSDDEDDELRFRFGRRVQREPASEPPKLPPQPPSASSDDSGDVVPAVRTQEWVEGGDRRRAGK